LTNEFDNCPQKMSEKARAVGGVKPGMIGITSTELGNLESPRGTTDLILALGGAKWLDSLEIRRTG
jgi:hypothetical protein